MVLVKIRAFNIEILLMLIGHRILWKENTVKMAGDDIYRQSPIFSFVTKNTF